MSRKVKISNRRSLARTKSFWQKLAINVVKLSPSYSPHPLLSQSGEIIGAKLNDIELAKAIVAFGFPGA